MATFNDVQQTFDSWGLGSFAEVVDKGRGKCVITAEGQTVTCPYWLGVMKLNQLGASRPGEWKG
jgi:hypothetical protein